MSPNPEHLPKPDIRTARDLMTPGVACIGDHEPVIRAAQKTAELGVGALPICGADERLKGMITDRDIVIKVLATGKDPAETLAGELAQHQILTIDADDQAQHIMDTMAAHKVRRLPVTDGQRLVGIISLADVARAQPHPKVGQLLNALSHD